MALGDHMPVHLGAMPMSVAATLDTLGSLNPGDVAMVNDPFEGGTHLPDITLLAPIHVEEHGPETSPPGTASAARTAGNNVTTPPAEGATPYLLGFVAARAHHSDVGGMTPGSMPLAREIGQEGLRIPPVRLWAQGQRNDDLWRLILSNVRTPEERAGDLEAQLASLNTGFSRLRELVARRGRGPVEAAMKELLAYADRLVASGLEVIPDGDYEAEDALEDDGFGSGPVPIRVRIGIRGQTATVDFTGSSPQVAGGVNAVSAITASATRYVLRCLIEALLGVEVPAGGGSLNAVRWVLPPGSVVNAEAPASVAAGNVETSQRITDVLLTAFRKAVPDHVPALSQGTMNNTTAGGLDPRTGRAFAYYETVGGGMGGGPSGPGLSGVHCHMSNSLNTPIEALEHAYPFQVVRYGLRRGSGGRGRHPGGEGIRRDLLLLSEAQVTLLSERRVRGPSGADGGEAGAPGRNVLIRDGREEELPGKVTFQGRRGDVISVRSPGGGGWGAAETVPPDPPHSDPIHSDPSRSE